MYKIYIIHDITDPERFCVMAYNTQKDTITSSTSNIRTHAEALADARAASEYHRSNFHDMTTTAPIIDLTR